MPYSIQNLLEGRNKPVSVKLDDSVQRALDLMIENDFSQLPVLDDEHIRFDEAVHKPLLEVVGAIPNEQ